MARIPRHIPWDESCVLCVKSVKKPTPHSTDHKTQASSIMMRQTHHVYYTLCEMSAMKRQCLCVYMYRYSLIIASSHYTYISYTHHVHKLHSYTATHYVYSLPNSYS